MCLLTTLFSRNPRELRYFVTMHPIAMADEMHNFYEDEDLYTFEMGSTPSLDQESYSGIPGEDDLVLVTKDNLEKRLAAAQNNQVKLDSSVEATPECCVL